MKRKNPQITATITESQHALLKAFSDVSGKSMSSLIADLVEAAEPHLQAVVEALSDVEAKREEISDIMQALLSSSAPDPRRTQSDMDEVWGRVRRVKKRA